MQAVNIYLTATCPYCIRAKQILKANGVDQLEEIRTDLDPAQRTQMMEIRKSPDADMSNLGPNDIIDAINYKYPQIKLEWVKQEGNKAFVKIADARYLTSGSGTEGANAYMAEVTFSLTELKGINEVNFNFIEGDHARPGAYTREDFKNFN